MTEPTIVQYARIKIDRHRYDNLVALANFLNVPDYLGMAEPELRQAILDKQQEVLRTYGVSE
jgi:hypothetical protein